MEKRQTLSVRPPCAVPRQGLPGRAHVWIMRAVEND